MKKKEQPRQREYWHKPHFIRVPASFHRQAQIKMGWEVRG